MARLSMSSNIPYSTVTHAGIKITTIGMTMTSPVTESAAPTMSTSKFRMPPALSRANNPGIACPQSTSSECYPSGLPSGSAPALGSTSTRSAQQYCSALIVMQVPPTIQEGPVPARTIDDKCPCLSQEGANPPHAPLASSACRTRMPSPPLVLVVVVRVGSRRRIRYWRDKQ